MGRTKKVVEADAPAKTPKAKVIAGKPKPEAVEPNIVNGFVIEDNIPIPARKRFGGNSIYPVANLQVGQSFIVPANVDADLYADHNELGKAIKEQLRTISNRLSGAVRRFTKKNEALKFRVAITDDGVRVWRTE